MVRPLEAAEAEEPSFPDQLLLDFNSGLPYRPPGDAASSSSSAAAAAAGKLHDDALLFRDFFGPGVDRLLELPTDGGDTEEEELEWLVNKDAFPGVETSFEIPTSGGGGGGGGGGSRSRGSAAASVGGERPSPISVLAAVSSFSVPVKPRSKGRRVQRRMLVGLTLPPAAKAVARQAAPAERRRCQHCQAEETPQWRAGPRGPKTLCNACGVRYKSGRLVPEYRPASSPTFSADIHSNSHRRIVEMRRQKAATNGGTPQRGRRGLPLLRP